MKGKDLAERVYKQIKTDLMLGKFDKDEMFNEQTFADMYGCSRTPAREAAGRLVLEGFLNKFPSKGYIVRVPGEKEVRELRECRYILECSVLKKIIQNASDEEITKLLDLPEGDLGNVLYTNNMIFHKQMAQLSGNDKLQEMIESLLYLLVRPIVTGRYHSYDNYAAEVNSSSSPISKEHKALVEALLKRDYNEASQVLKSDIYPTKY